MYILLRSLGLFALLMSVSMGTAAAAVSTVQAPAGSPTPAEMDAFVRKQMDDSGAPGVAYGIVDAKQVLHAGTFGTDGDGDDIGADTPFLWGSVAKPITATLVTMLASDGTLDLDARVSTYVPSFRLADRSVSDTITIRQLLAHTSGLPASYRLTDQFDRGRRPADVIADLADVEPVHEAGAEHTYSSVNYLVLAAVVEKVTGTSFGVVLQERLLQPFGMTRTITTADDAHDRLPPGHRYVLGRAAAFTTPYDPAGAAYGYLGGDLHDLMSFARAALGGSPDVVTDDQRKQLFHGEVGTGDGQEYGLGWRRWSLKSADIDAPGDMIWHGGAVAGYQTMVVLLPDLGRAIVVEQNAYGSFQEPELLETAFGLAAMMHGESPRDVSNGPTYALMLAVFIAGVLMLAALIGHATWRIARPRAGRRAGRVAVGLGVTISLLGGLAYGLAAYLPSTMGVGIDQIVLWAPDLAWLQHGSLALIAALLCLRVGVAVREVRSDTDLMARR